MKKLLLFILLLPYFSYSQKITTGRKAYITTGLHTKQVLVNEATPAPFVPTDIAGCKLWLYADSVRKDAFDYIYNWADQSGNNNNATAFSGSNEPLYVSNQINGHPVVRFDGSNDYLENLGFAVAQPYTIFIVWTGGNTNPAVFGSLISNGSGVGCYFWGWNYLGDNNIYISAGATKLYAAPAKPFTLYSTAIFNGANSFLYENGVQKINNNFGTNNILNYDIGGVGTGDCFNKDIAEVIIYNSALGTTDRESVENYLATKYGL